MTKNYMELNVILMGISFIILIVLFVVHKTNFPSTGKIEEHKISGHIQLYPLSTAQINALIPAAVGQAYYCNDFTTVSVYISTGIAVGAFTSYK